jgi:hypothetical protein
MIARNMVVIVIIAILFAATTTFATSIPLTKLHVQTNTVNNNENNNNNITILRYTFNGIASLTQVFDITDLTLYTVTDDSTGEVIPPTQVVPPSPTSIVIIPTVCLT